MAVEKNALGGIYRGIARTLRGGINSCYLESMRFHLKYYIYF